MKTKIFSLFLMLTISIGTICASDTSVGGIWYDFDSFTLTAQVTYRGSSYSAYSNEYSGAVTIPSSVTYNGNTYSVTNIGTYAFCGCTGLTSVTIGNRVNYIGQSAFSGCTSLTSVTIPSRVTNINSYAFSGCTNLMSVTIPNIIKTIGNNAFFCVNNIEYSGSATGAPWGAKSINGYVDGYLVYRDSSKAELLGCSSSVTGKITIPNSVTCIGNYAFYGCEGLTSLTIPDSVTCIGNYAFSGCKRLTSLTIPDSVTSIGDYAFSGCKSLTSLTLPDNITSIGDYAFSGCSVLKSLTIPNSVTSIGERTFWSCSSLTSIEIPNSVTSIGESAFNDCTSLKSLTIPKSVTNIGSAAFARCTSLRGVYISDIASWCAINFVGIESNPLHFAQKLYMNGALITNLSIPDSVISIGKNAFYDCTSLTSVTIPNSVTTIGQGAFSGCTSLTSVTIPNSVTTIGQGAFSGCTGLRGVYISDIASWCAITFNGGYLANPLYYAHNLYVNGNLMKDLVIPEGVKSIKNCAFQGCYSLTSVSLSNSVISIGDYAFVECRNLTSVTEEAITPPTLGGNNIFPNGISIYVPCGTLDAYKDAWSAYRNAVKYPSIPYVIYAAESYEHGRVDVNDYGTICDSIPVIITATPDLDYHFVQWNDGNTENPRTILLTQDTTFTAEFAINKSGTCGEDMVLNWAFDDSTKTLTISGSGALTENYTFGLEAPTQMEHLVIGNEVTAIGDSAFYGKTTIAQVTIGGNVTFIGNYAFANIDNRQLTSIVMPAELTTIGDYAFSGNTYLESIDFNAKLLSIGAYAFKDCRRVSEMTCMAETTPDVGTNALSSINSYASLCVPASCVRKYQVDPNWGRFDLCELGATTSTGSVTTVIVEPSDNTALFTWPTENDAATYTLQITKDGEVFCTLVFNANGQLTGIAFAPSRTDAPHAPAATLANGAMQFTVTGLNIANKYAYRLAVTDASNVELQSYSGEFATTGYEGEVNPGGEPESGHEDVDQLHQDPASNTHKFLHNGQILILRGDRTYTVSGQEIK